MSKTYGIGDVLAQSQRLTSQIGHGLGIKRVRRGVHELDEATKMLIGSDRRPDPISDQRANRLLSQHAFDAEGLMKTVNTMELKTQYDPTERLESTDIEGYLAHHHDMIILTAIDEARRAADEDAQEMQRRWAADEWTRSRRVFLESLGHKTQRWTGTAALTATRATPFTPTRGTRSVPSTPQRMYPSTPHRNPPSRVLERESQASPLLKGHMTVLRRMNEVVAERSQAAVFLPASELVTYLENVDPDVAAQENMQREDLTGYRTCLQLLSCMTGEHRPEPHSPGYFSPTVLESHQIAPDIMRDRRIELSTGAKHFLEHQFDTYVTAKVDRAVAKGHIARSLPIAHGQSRLDVIRSYIRLQHRASLIPEGSCQTLDVCNGDDIGVPVWPQVYSCLRSGALREARAVLDVCIQNSVAGVDAVALSVVDGLLELMNASNRRGEIDTHKIVEAMTQCHDLYFQLFLDATAFAEHVADTAVDPYRIQVLNLLGLADIESLSKGTVLPDTTMEDFLWSSLWFIQWSRLLGTSRSTKLPSATKAARTPTRDMMLVPRHAKSPGSTMVPVMPRQYSEDDLYKRVLEAGGGDYFDADRTTPFKYALVLFACQQFGEGIAYLWRACRSFSGVHLTAICLYYGLIAPTMSLTAGDEPMFDDSQLTPSTVLHVWTTTNSYLLSSADAAVEYVMMLNAPWLRYIKGIDKELYETFRFQTLDTFMSALETILGSSSERQVKLLVGDLNPAGGRSQGHIDQYLSHDQITQLLARTAYTLLVKRGETERAIHLYSLAGMYAEVVEELCTQLSVSMMPQHALRDYWKKAATSFYERHLAPGSGYVVDALQRAGKVNLAHVLEKLLNISAFVDCCVQRRWADALKILDNLHLIPTSEGSVESAAQQFSHMESSIRRVADDVLLCYADCIRGLHEEMRIEASAAPNLAGGSQHRNNRLQALLTRTQVLIAFTGLIKARLNRPNTLQSVASLEPQIL